MRTPSHSHKKYQSVSEWTTKGQNPFSFSPQSKAGSKLHNSLGAQRKLTSSLTLPLVSSALKPFDPWIGNTSDGPMNKAILEVRRSSVASQQPMDPSGIGNKQLNHTTKEQKVFSQILQLFFGLLCTGKPHYWWRWVYSQQGLRHDWELVFSCFPT